VNENRIAKLQAVLLQDPADSFSKYALALEYAGGGKFVEAISRLEELLHHDPRYVPAYQQLGYLLQKLNRPAEARIAFARGIEEAARQSDHHSAGEMQEALDELK
jgi:Tfp pilus assembly protein PilF